MDLPHCAKLNQFMAKAKHPDTYKQNRIADKIMEWGNLVFIGLVISQAINGLETYNGGLVLVGILGMAGAYITAFFLMTGGEHDD